MRKIGVFMFVFLVAAPVSSNQVPDSSVWPKSWPPELVDKLSYLEEMRPAHDGERFLQSCTWNRQISDILQRTKDQELPELSPHAINQLELFAMSCLTLGMRDTEKSAKSEQTASRKEALAAAFSVYQYTRSAELLRLSTEVRGWLKESKEADERYGALVGRYNGLVERYNNLAENSDQLRSTLLDMQVDNAILRASQRLLSMPRPISLSCTSNTIDFGYGFKRTEMDCH